LLLRALRLELRVHSSVLLRLLYALHLGYLEGALALQGQRSHQALNLRALGHFLALLVGEGALHHKLAHVVRFVQVEQLADFGRALGAQAAGHHVVGEARHFGVALLDHRQVEHRNVGPHDAAAHRLALALAGLALAVARGAAVQEQPHAGVEQDALRCMAQVQAKCYTRQNKHSNERQ